jgi:hypothetical protein
MKRKRIPNGKNTLSFSPWLQQIFRMAKVVQERQGVIFIDLTEASRRKRFFEKVVLSDEPMVPPVQVSDHPVTHRIQYSR